jgi:hypothetical protein
VADHHDHLVADADDVWAMLTREHHEKQSGPTLSARRPSDVIQP